MTPYILLALAEALEVNVAIKDGKITAKGQDAALTVLLPLLRTYKDALQRHFSEGNTYCFAQLYQERAAIMQYDGGLSREEAERVACREVLKEFIAHLYPSILAEF